MTFVVDGSTSVPELGRVLLDQGVAIAVRNRAAFWLREKGDDDARAWLERAVVIKGDSVLLRHEVAYILGQLGHREAVETLCQVVADVEDAAIVRHEAAEALGAIGDDSSLETLEKFQDDAAPEVRETCRLALDLLNWRRDHPDPTNVYRSTDPAPPADDSDVESLKRQLLGDASLWTKYRAMFALRDLGTTTAVAALAEALTSDDLGSDLLRHELAFVLGQLASPAAKSALVTVLRDTTVHAMVRHEAAEALGALPDTDKILASFANDNDLIVQQSCEVALDAMAYYADS